MCVLIRGRKLTGKKDGWDSFSGQFSCTVTRDVRLAERHPIPPPPELTLKAKEHKGEPLYEGIVEGGRGEGLERRHSPTNGGLVPSRGCCGVGAGDGPTGTSRATELRTLEAGDRSGGEGGGQEPVRVLVTPSHCL